MPLVPVVACCMFAFGPSVICLSLLQATGACSLAEKNPVIVVAASLTQNTFRLLYDTSGHSELASLCE